MPVDQDASGVGLLLAARSGDIEIVRSLIRQGAELEQRDILGDSGLLKAARYGHAQVVELLLMAGVDVNAYDNSGWTALHTSIANGREEVAFVLLSGYHQPASINIEATTSNGDTPLHMAAFHGREWAVEILLRLGANRGAINDRGERPIQVARHNTVRAMLGPSTGSPNQDEESAAGFASSFEEGEGDVPRNIPTNANFGHRTIGGGNGRENAAPGAGVVEGVGRPSFYETSSYKAKNRRVHRVLSQMEKSTFPSVEQESRTIGDNEHFDRFLNGSLVSSHVSTETEVGFASLQKRGSDSSFEEASSEGELSLDSRMAQHDPAEEIIPCGTGDH
ncbi:unnamed protein product [Ectocarpus sp. 12 AP-2014]